MASSGDEPTGAGIPFLSSTTNNHNDDDDDDIEALASKACALASVPVPDYAEAINRSNARSKKKYGNRFTIDDDDAATMDDDDLDLDGKEREEEDKFSSSGIVLAERTSQILSNFQDYVS
eukprot:CAMPEP_0172315846 /NCGR_PEP_ID=MMETSP1058-20130122/26475_1 /TAXON_ID=83371 /ORGANISM="Detonula confervacea, Strain CCMP 353" /LENGTH=119 /DNA_ID=CAMNT_0013030021 /DNA_START=9 /DNA_END=365 /DNA_ORIENTATION=-